MFISFERASHAFSHFLSFSLCVLLPLSHCLSLWPSLSFRLQFHSQSPPLHYLNI
uniref:Uncharacterized protein n=1 Tax=Octopus bimaculoides TaxID=37653 RepID=A0A0L8I9B9_OCTBM